MLPISHLLRYHLTLWSSWLLDVWCGGSVFSQMVPPHWNEQLFPNPPTTIPLTPCWSFSHHWATTVWSDKHSSPTFTSSSQLCHLQGRLSVSISHRRRCCTSSASHSLAREMSSILLPCQPFPHFFCSCHKDAVVPLCVLTRFSFCPLFLTSPPSSILLHPFALLPWRLLWCRRTRPACVPASLVFHHHSFHPSQPPLIFLLFPFTPSA